MALFSDYVCVVSKSTPLFPVTEARAGPCSAEAVKCAGLPQQDGRTPLRAVSGQEEGRRAGRMPAGPAGTRGQPWAAVGRAQQIQPVGAFAASPRGA